MRTVFRPAATCKAQEQTNRLDRCSWKKDKGTTRESNTLVKISDWSLPLVAGDLLFKFCLFCTEKNEKIFRF